MGQSKWPLKAGQRVWRAGRKARESIAPPTASSSRKGKNSSKLNERTGNLYENKGRLRRTWERSWNVNENKGGKPSNAGMFMKIKGLIRLRYKPATVWIFCLVRLPPPLQLRRFSFLIAPAFRPAAIVLTWPFCLTRLCQGVKLSPDGHPKGLVGRGPLTR